MTSFLFQTELFGLEATVLGMQADELLFQGSKLVLEAHSRLFFAVNLALNVLQLAFSQLSYHEVFVLVRTLGGAIFTFELLLQILKSTLDII